MAEFDEQFKAAGKRKVVIEVDYNDVDDLITRNFPNMKGGQYECVAYEEWGNYEDHSMDINGKLDYGLEDIHKMMDSGIWPHYQTSTILNYLCSLGVIEPAEYLISIFW